MDSPYRHALLYNLITAFTFRLLEVLENECKLIVIVIYSKPQMVSLRVTYADFKQCILCKDAELATT